MKYGLGRTILALAVIGVLAAATPAMAALTVFHTWTGNVALSTNGWGNATAPNGAISADVPLGATVLAAYLYSTPRIRPRGPPRPSTVTQ